MTATKQASPRGRIETLDPIWTSVRAEAEEVIANERALGGFIFATILSHDRLEDAICHRLAQRLNHADVDAGLIGQTVRGCPAIEPRARQRLPRRSRRRL